MHLIRSYNKCCDVFSSFNNILSNLGYVMLGLLFLLIVLQRDILHNRALERNENTALVSSREHVIHRLCFISTRGPAELQPDSIICT